MEGVVGFPEPPPCPPVSGVPPPPPCPVPPPPPCPVPPPSGAAQNPHSMISLLSWFTKTGRNTPTCKTAHVGLNNHIWP